MGEQEKKKTGRFKSKLFWAKVAGVIVVLSMFYGFGSSGAAVELEDGKASLEELQAKIEEKESKIKEVEKELEKVNSKFDDRKSELNEALSVLENKESIESEIKKLEKKVSNKQSEIKSLSKEVDTKLDKISSLNGQIVEAKGKPITLPAGHFTVGKDIPSSRYMVTPNQRGGNFFVNGGMKVNIMLGKDTSMYQNKYIFYADKGDTIELTLSATFTPVE